MTNRWTDDEKEELYLFAKSSCEEISIHRTLDPSSDIILKIHSRLDGLERDTKSILYKLAEMGFLRKGKDTYETNRFFVNQLKPSDFHNFTVKPSFKKLTLSQASEFSRCFEREACKINDVQKLCLAISGFMKISCLRVTNELWDKKFIRLNPIMNYELVSPMTITENDEQLKGKDLSVEHKERINGFRHDVSYLYDTHSKNNPSITYSSDGTGTGKSYSVINSFIKETDMEDIAFGHRNLLFLTPQKAQIDIDKSLVEDAKNKGIKLLSFLAQGDISNIKFKNWVTGV